MFLVTFVFIRGVCVLILIFCDLCNVIRCVVVYGVLCFFCIRFFWVRVRMRLGLGLFGLDLVRVSVTSCRSIGLGFC